MESSRNVIKKLLKNACDSNAEFISISKDKQESIVRKLERSCYNYVVTLCLEHGMMSNFNSAYFINNYSLISSKILLNLDNSSSLNSTYLLNRVLSGEINPETIAQLSSEDLCPEANKKYREAINLRRNLKNIRKVSKAHKCRKCGKNETTMIEIQMRSADEAATFSIECEHCGTRWRS